MRDINVCSVFSSCCSAPTVPVGPICLPVINSSGLTMQHFMTLFGLTNYHTPLSLSLSQERGIEKQYLPLDAEPTLAVQYVHSIATYMFCLLASILYAVLHECGLCSTSVFPHFYCSWSVPESSFHCKRSLHKKKLVKTYLKAVWSFYQNKLNHSKNFKLNKTQQHRISYYTSEALRALNFKI